MLIEKHRRILCDGTLVKRSEWHGVVCRLTSYTVLPRGADVFLMGAGGSVREAVADAKRKIARRRAYAEQRLAA